MLFIIILFIQSILLAIFAASLARNQAPQKRLHHDAKLIGECLAAHFSAYLALYLNILYTKYNCCSPAEIGIIILLILLSAIFCIATTKNLTNQDERLNRIHPEQLCLGEKCPGLTSKEVGQLIGRNVKCAVVSLITGAIALVYFF
jgi:hypothetical protein